MNVVLLKRALTVLFSIYRYISIYGALGAVWIAPGGQGDIGNMPCDARECPNPLLAMPRAITGQQQSD